MVVLVWACISSGALMAGASQLAAVVMLLVGSVVLVVAIIVYNVIRQSKDTTKVAPDDGPWFRGSGRVGAPPEACIAEGLDDHSAHDGEVPPCNSESSIRPEEPLDAHRDGLPPSNTSSVDTHTQYDHDVQLKCVNDYSYNMFTYIVSSYIHDYTVLPQDCNQGTLS